MLRLRSVITAGVSALVCLAVVGCTPGVTPSAPSSVPPSTPPPTSAAPSQAEALKEARVSYTGYIRAVEEMGAEGMPDMEALRPFVVSESLSDEVEGIEELASEGLTLRGHADLVEFQIQAYDAERRLLTAYACIDLAAVRVVDSDGKDVTPDARPDRQTSVPNFRVADGTVKLIKDATWSGDPIC